MFATCNHGERNIRRADAAPRGSAKSTLKTLIKPIHDFCYGLEKFILIISSTNPLAFKKLKDIRHECKTNQALRVAYGIHFPARKAGETEFLVRSHFGECYFVALGRGSEVRGIRINEARPTKIILDDVEHSDEVYSEERRKKTENWFFEDVTKAGDTGTNIEFIGTVLHPDSLLKKVLNNPAYVGRIYQSVISWSEREDLWNKWREIYNNKDNLKRLEESEAFYKQNEKELLKGTKVLWPEKEDYLALMKEMEEIGRRAFMKEKQNEPQGSENPVFERIHWYKEIADGIQIEETGEIIKWATIRNGCGGAIDPSTGQMPAKGKRLGDYSCLLTGYKDPKGRVLVHHDFTKRVSPTKYITEIFELHAKFKYDRFAVETNLFRNLLLPNILDERKRREKESGKTVQIAFYDVVQTENKMERIYRLEPKVNHGWILFNRALSRDFMNMVTDFPGDYDDGPDALEILWNLFHNRYKPAGVSIDVFAGR